ncbi:hypothetical protein [Thiohalorhabdus sp.]|uniref:hypothetical protein n=1 Tax=Thiohalorhabdus sp. TaxID=3094134 RepID=UPI002FC347C2
MAGNPPGVPGEDAYHDRLLKRHLDAQEAQEAWEARVSEWADDLQADDPTMPREDAVEKAEELIREHDRAEEERRAQDLADDREERDQWTCR